MFGQVNRYFSVAELLFWTSFMVWSSNTFFTDTHFIIYVNFLTITIGFVLISWFFLRDYISGVQIKSRYNLSPGQSFISGPVRGVVKRMGLLLLEVKAENGSDYKIPYAQIDQKSIELNFQEKSGGESMFTVLLDTRLSETRTVHKLTELIINSPWSSHKSLPIIKISEAENDLKSYEISCVTIGEGGMNQLKALIQKEFSQRKR